LAILQQLHFFTNQLTCSFNCLQHSLTKDQIHRVS